MNAKRLSIYGLAILSAIFVGYADLHAKEVQGSVILILIVTFVLGFVEPKRAWLWALLIGLSVSAAYLVAPIVSIQPLENPQPSYGTLIALIPAFIGAFSGAITHRAVRFSLNDRLSNQ